MEFRNLKADEIECRINTIDEKGLSLLLYKDARVDQNILDETVGAMNWQRKHTRDNANCIVEIWDNNKLQWIAKEDTGTESYTEKEKGLASDSFKRACFNWGIGRELYTAPFIYIGADKCDIKQINGKWNTRDKFIVQEIKIENKVIMELKIANLKTGIVVFKYQKEKVEFPEDSLINDTKAKILYKALVNKLGDNQSVIKYLTEKYKVDNTSQITNMQYAEICREMK